LINRSSFKLILSLGAVLFIFFDSALFQMKRFFRPSNFIIIISSIRGAIDYGAAKVV